MAVIEGTAGNDSLTGTVDTDVINGNVGNDTLAGEDGNDVLDGGDGNDSLLGGVGNDILYGQAGNDTMRGGIGSDSLLGGTGDDTYYLENAGDGASEQDGGGYDRVYTDIDTTMADGIEELNLMTGNSGTGNATGNLVYGNGNSNTINGLAGDDSLYGDAGDDYVGGGDDNDDLYGWTGNDTLVGGEGNDELYGQAGNDSLVGGGGNDYYEVTDAGDVVVELADGGTDQLVVSFGDYVLPDHIENFVVSGAISEPTTATANALNNQIVNSAQHATIYGLGGDDYILSTGGNESLEGGEGNDSLEGGTGNDTLVGGSGDDTYYADTADNLVELESGGYDTVVVEEDWILGDNFEAASLGDSGNALTGNSVDNDLTGNSLANQLDGAAGNDTCSGGDGRDTIDGGNGNDLLVGGAGADRFAFSTRPNNSTNADSVEDFTRGSDKFVLENAVFKGLKAGALASGAFTTGTKAKDAGDRIIYDKASGKLYYDADGTGKAAKVLFADLDTTPTLAAGDFIVT